MAGQRKCNTVLTFYKQKDHNCDLEKDGVYVLITSKTFPKPSLCPQGEAMAPAPPVTAVGTPLTQGLPPHSSF